MSRRKRNWRVRATTQQMESIALVVLDEDQRAIAEGYHLTGSSGVWRRGNGTFTVKLVYRRRNAGWPSTLAFTIRNVSHGALLRSGQAR